MTDTPEPALVTLAVLAEMVERARAQTGLSPEMALLRALERGLAFLEAQIPSEQEPVPVEAAGADLASAARFDALRARALVLAEQIEALETVVYSQADESRALQDELWQLRAERDAARARLGRPGPATPRPEPPLTIGLGGPGKQPPPLAGRLLRGQHLVSLDIQLPPGLRARLQALTESPGWPADWTEHEPLLVVAHGLAALEARLDGPAGAPAATRHVDLLDLSTLYRQVLEWEQAVKILRLRQRGLEVDNAGMRAVIQRLRDEVASLSAELAAQEGSAERRPGRGRGRFWPFGRR